MDHLFVVTQGPKNKGKVSKPAIIRWLRDTISICYKMEDRPFLESIQAHPTKATVQVLKAFAGRPCGAHQSPPLATLGYICQQERILLLDIHYSPVFFPQP